MNSIYGYYLAHLQWDDLTGIFSPTGSIEIAMRGVYVGAASVRRNLNLYGQATDDQFGLQHNHMQFQPVVTVAPDGQSAKVRSRALSIMGNWERNSQWMGGVYENDFVKEGGVWKIKRDQVFNTYFIPYTRRLEGRATAPAARHYGHESAGCAADLAVRDVSERVSAAVPLSRIR